MTDVKVVAPVNMGKGIVWNEQTKQYEVAYNDNILTLDDLGRLTLRVSTLEDNMLKIRGDGLYQGNTARQDIANLFVSNNGNDSNAGTREAPLKTIQEALNRLENIPATYVIHLHENHQFDWVRASVPNATIYFKAYGATIDSQYPDATASNTYYRGYVAKSYPRPIINVKTEVWSNFISRQFLYCADVNFRGIRVNLWTKYEGVDDGTLSGHFNGFVDTKNTITLHGCILDEKSKGVPVGNSSGAYRNDVAMRSPRILWIDSIAENMPWLVSSIYTSQLSVAAWDNGNLQGLGVMPDHESLTPAVGAIEAMTKDMKANIFSVIFDEQYKTVHGMLLNWNVFA